MPIGKPSTLGGTPQAGAYPPAPNAPGGGPLPRAVGLATVGYSSERHEATEGTPGAGLAQIDVGTPAVGTAWLVERMSVYSNSAQNSQVGVYLDAVDPGNRLDYTPNGNDDIADENNAIYVPGGSTLIVAWQSLSAGADCKLRIQYRVVVPTTLVAGAG